MWIWSLGIREKFCGAKSGECGGEGWFNYGIPCFDKNSFIDTAVVMQGKTAFSFMKLRFLIDEFFEPNAIIFPQNILYSLSDLMEQILCEWFLDCRRVWPTSLCFLWLLKSKILCLGTLGERHFMLSVSIRGSYWKKQVSPAVTFESSKERSSSTDWISSW